MKLCQHCQTHKPTSDFWKNKSTKDGLQAWCKDCWKDITALRRNGPKREIELRQRQNRHLIRNFNITIEKYEQILESQNGNCAICGTNPDYKRRLSVDHDHATGRIRGILCENCNRALGQFKDSAGILRNAIKYIER